MDIKTMSLDELNALGYRMYEEREALSERLSSANNNIILLRQEISLRAQTPVEPKEVPEEQPKEEKTESTE